MFLARSMGEEKRMRQNVQIRLLGSFDILVDGARQNNLAAKSRKGVSLMEYLILQRGKAVTVQRLIRELWSGTHYDRPESALKTMISRFRALLNSVYPGLGGCIVSEQGAYRWVSGGVRVDVLEMLEQLERAHAGSSRDEKIAAYSRVQELYRGELFQTGDITNGALQVNWLHREYLHAMYSWIELLQETGDYGEICRVCRKAIEVDAMDEQLHLELIRAMMQLKNFPEAVNEYRLMAKTAHRSRKSEKKLGEDYRGVMDAGDLALQTLNEIGDELMSRNAQQTGPFFCEFEEFKETYCIQRYTMERLGATMFLGIIMVNNSEGITAVARESAMAAVCEIVRSNLRRGDVVTRAAPAVIAMLLPTVSYSTGGMVMERIESLFYEEYPDKTITLSSRVTPLGGSIAEGK